MKLVFLNGDLLRESKSQGYVWVQDRLRFSFELRLTDAVSVVDLARHKRQDYVGEEIYRIIDPTQKMKE
jgi:hypothetical protein